MSRKRRQPKIRHFRNADAEAFIRLAKYRKRQESEIEQMNRSFEVRDELDQRFEYAVAKDR